VIIILDSDTDFPNNFQIASIYVIDFWQKFLNCFSISPNGGVRGRTQNILIATVIKYYNVETLIGIKFITWT
jgi:hypothetical protein